MIVYKTKDGKYQLNLTCLPNALYTDLQPGNAPVENGGGNPNTVNCGMGIITGGGLYWQSTAVPTATKRRDPWDPAPTSINWYLYPEMYRPPKAGQPDYYKQTNRPNDLPNLTPDEVWSIFCTNFPKYAALLPASIYGMSNTTTGSRAALAEQRQLQRGKGISVFNPDASDPRPFAVTSNIWLMKAIRETKCGMLITTPIIENQNHPGTSAIMAAWWIPPGKESRILHEKVGIMRGDYTNYDPTKTRERLTHLGESAADFVEYFYGRKKFKLVAEGNGDEPAGGVSVPAARG